MSDLKTRGAAFFDLDHTLLDHNSWKIPSSAMEGIRLLRENGFLICIASGRDMMSLLAKPYYDEVSPDCLIHMNGTSVMLGDKVLCDHYMSPDLVERVVEFGLKIGEAVGGTVDGKDYYSCPEDVRRFDLSYWGFDGRKFQDPRLLKNEKVRELCFFGRKESLPLFRKEFPELDFFLFTSITGADVVEKGYSKADGIERICKETGIPIENTVAFGDSFNDILMLEKAGLGICMGNGMDSAKEKADFVTDRIDNDGILKAVKMILEGRLKGRKK